LLTIANICKPSRSTRPFPRKLDRITPAATSVNAETEPGQKLAKVSDATAPSRH
jgi:hypothetical protein